VSGHRPRESPGRPQREAQSLQANSHWGARNSFLKTYPSLMTRSPTRREVRGNLYTSNEERGVSRGGLGPWENEEMRAARDERVRDESFRVIPAERCRSVNPSSPSLLNRLSQVRTVVSVSSSSCAIAGTPLPLLARRMIRARSTSRAAAVRDRASFVIAAFSSSVNFRNLIANGRRQLVR
jgi:hypothetical protein